MATATDFDPLRAPLTGVNLIEASAGTGKTYQLTSLYLRLLTERRLPVDRILVVTFTRAATHELSERIRRRIAEALDALSGATPKDPFLAGLAKKDDGLFAALLENAAQRMDEARIFTIHGFCQRLLAECAFESGQPYGARLTPGEEPFLRELSEDFYRRHFHDADPAFAAWALDQGIGPARFRAVMEAAVRSPGTRILGIEEAAEIASEEGFRESLDALRAAWPRDREAVRTLLLDPALDARTYGNAKKTGGSGKSLREEKVDFLCREMDAVTGPGMPSLPLFRQFRFFTASCVRSKVSKKTDPGDFAHPFFDLCENLAPAAEDLGREMDRKMGHLDYMAARTALTELSERKRARRVMTFGDLIERVAEALERGPSSPLAVAAANQYGAALIDEFQDTDPLQYAIFKTLFARDDQGLFLIGDPKQAIYGFRGADLFSYLAAADEADRRATLDRNWRSDPGVIAGVNTFFANRPAPFVLEGVDFHPARPAEKEREEFRLPGADAPVSLWFVEPETDGSGKTPAKAFAGAARETLAGAVAAEASRLVGLGRQKRAFVGKEPLSERHLAVLTRTNQEAITIQEALAEQGLHGVLQTTANLFDTPDARELYQVLAALARPSDPVRIRTALSTRLFGLDARSLDALSRDPAAYETVAGAFSARHALWRRQGFLRMFERLLREEAVRPRLLSAADGPRRLVNTLHLAEVLHTAESGLRLGMAGLVKWLARQMDPEAPRLEEHQLRLETDAEAVEIVTVHRSKGLEFPVVFCPFLWGQSRADRILRFHDPENGHRMTLDLVGEDPAHRAQAELEALAENVRLFYVAATRARHRLALAWGNINMAGTSAPAYLFHGADLEPSEAANRYKSLDTGTIREEVQALADASEGAVEVVPPPDSAPPLPPAGDRAAGALSCRTFRGGFDRSFQVTSFSSLAHQRSREAEPPGLDEEEILYPGPRDVSSGAGGFLDFPRGPEAGTMLHAFLERLDFCETDPRKIEELARETLRGFGMDKNLAPDVADMAGHLVQSPLDPADPGLVLSRVPLENRLVEMEFLFPLKALTPASLSRAFEGLSLPPGLGMTPSLFSRLGFSPVRGFVRGFVDLVFRHKGRYYLADWKSNHLGEDPEDYRGESLAFAMAGHLYVLQYHLYALALHRHLSQRLPGYDYGRHFGGVFYVFLRGVNRERPGDGVFRDRPDLSRIQKLSEALLP